MDSYKSYEIARAATWNARKWYEMRLKRDSQYRTPFRVCKAAVSLTMYGQDYAGAKNYHDSPKELNDALAKVLIERWEELTQAAIAKLEGAERAAMVACKGDLHKMLSAIEQAEDA